MLFLVSMCNRICIRSEDKGNLNGMMVDIDSCFLTARLSKLAGFLGMFDLNAKPTAKCFPFRHWMGVILQTRATERSWCRHVETSRSYFRCHGGFVSKLEKTLRVGLINPILEKKCKRWLLVPNILTHRHFWKSPGSAVKRGQYKPRSRSLGKHGCRRCNIWQDVWRFSKISGRLCLYIYIYIYFFPTYDFRCRFRVVSPSHHMNTRPAWSWSRA